MATAGLRSCVAVPAFRRMLMAFAISRSGDLLYGVSLVVIVLERSGDPAYVAALAVVRLLPVVLVGPLAGALADRVDRRRLMVLADVGRLACMGLLALVVAADQPPELMIAVAAVTACIGSAFQPAFMATLPDTLREDQLASGNSLISGVEYVAIVLGPVGSFTLLVLGHDSVPFLLNAASFAISALLLVGIGPHRPEAPEPSNEGPLRRLVEDLAAGVSAMRSDRNLSVLVGAVMLLCVTAGFESVYLVLAADERLGMDSSGVGLLDAGFGVGGILAVAAAARFARSRRPQLVLGTVLVLCAAPLGLFALLTHPAAGIAVMVISGGASVVLDVVASTTMQRAVPSHLLARCDALLTSSAQAGLVTGALIAPVLLGLVGLRPALLLGAVVPTALALLALSRSRRLDSLSAAAADRLAPAVTALAKTDVFAALSLAALERLASQAVESQARSGDVLLLEGERAEALMVLLEGTCDVTQGPDEQLVAQVVAPDVIGEIGLLHNLPRSATVRATSDCRLLQVPGRLFLATVLNDPSRASSVQALAERRLARSGAGA